MNDLDKLGERAPKDAAPVTFRRVEPRDEPFLFSVFASTRTEELAQVPWDEAQRDAFLKAQFAAQQRHYQNHYPDATHEIILLKDQPIGRVYINRGDQYIRIIDITILPEYRNAGIGTRILEDLRAEAAQAGKSITIYVESFNRSLRLFERLGFSRIEERGVHFLMEWHA